jgi:hypothetical protein
MVNVILSVNDAVQSAQQNVSFKARFARRSTWVLAIPAPFAPVGIGLISLLTISAIPVGAVN